MTESASIVLTSLTGLMQDVAAGGWWAFGRPWRILQADRLDQVRDIVREAEREVEAQGCWAIGCIAYEAAPAFDSALHTRAAADGLPLVWFALCPQPRLVSLSDVMAGGELADLDWQPCVGRADYEHAIARIRSLIAAGDTYQVNYTIRLRAPFHEAATALFHRMQSSGASRYGAYLNCGRFVLCSASPELFLRVDGERIESRPMKGTAPRGRWWEDDQARADRLVSSDKERAENVMIVDMMRNDLARIAHSGSVRVSALFQAERYATLWQMTSSVVARSDASIEEILTATFPPASITGAPKARTMAIIGELETSPRGMYTGSMGFMAPGRRAQFNVAIRTAVVDVPGRSVEYGVGSGVVWDSRSASEYDECLLKARILSDRPPPFSLLETLLWEPVAGYFLLDRHLARLWASARYFDFALDIEMVRARLMAAAEGCEGHARRVRLTVNRDGDAQVTASALAPPSPSPVRLRRARQPVDPDDSFLFHKTTHRQVYEAARADVPDADDAVLWNSAGEITETSIANLVLERDGRRLTPALQCGLLPGVFRAHLLQEGAIEEAKLTLDDLRNTPRIWLINSLRRWREAVML